MIDDRIFYDVTFGVLSIQLSLKKYELFNSYLSGVHNHGAIIRMVEELKVFQRTPEVLAEKYWGPGEHAILGAVDFIGGNDKVGRLNKEGKIVLVDNRGKGLDPLYFEVEDLLKLYRVIAPFFEAFEVRDSFEESADLSSLIQEKHLAVFTTQGFERKDYTKNMVRFNKSAISLQFIEEEGNLDLVVSNTLLEQTYPFTTVLECFNWNAARLHTLKCDKYKMSLPRAEARTAILQSIMTNLEAYCLPPLAASLDTFLQRLEDYSQDQSRLLEAVRALPKHNKARQLFDSGSLQWIDFVREEAPMPFLPNDQAIAKEEERTSQTPVFQITPAEILKMAPNTIEPCDDIYQEYLAWNKLKEEDENRLIIIGEIALDEGKVTTHAPIKEAMKQYWSAEAPIAFDTYPYNGCEVYRLKSCSSLYLVYTEYAGHAPEKRCRLIQKKLITPAIS